MSSTSSREYSRPPSVFVHSSWPCGGSPRRASTFSKPRRAHLVERGAQLVDRGADAGEVRHRLQADLVADARDDLERLAARRAAGAVGDADEVRRQRSQAGQRQVEVRLALGRAGREELEGEHRAIARGVDLVDAHRAHGTAVAVKFGALMPIDGVRAVLVRVCERSPVPRLTMLDNLLSKVIAAGLAAGVFLLWWPAHLPSTGVQWLVLRGLAWTLAFEILVLSFVPFERMATRALVRRREGGRAARVRRRLAAAPAPARASGAVMLAFTGLLLPGLLLLHSGRLPAAQPAAHTTKVVRRVVVRKVVHEKTVVVREAAPAAVPAPYAASAALATAAEAPKAVDEDLDAEGSWAVVEEDRREDDPAHDRRRPRRRDQGCFRTRRPRPLRRTRRPPRLRPTRPLRRAETRPRRVLRRCAARASREGSPRRSGRVPSSSSACALVHKAHVFRHTSRGAGRGWARLGAKWSPPPQRPPRGGAAETPNVGLPPSGGGRTDVRRRSRDEGGAADARGAAAPSPR